MSTCFQNNCTALCADLVKIRPRHSARFNRCARLMEDLPDIVLLADRRLSASGIPGLSAQIHVTSLLMPPALSVALMSVLPVGIVKEGSDAAVPDPGWFGVRA